MKAAVLLGMSGVLESAEKALPWVDAMASARAGGAIAFARTIARCGRAGRVAYSMLGAVPLDTLDQLDSTHVKPRC